MFRRQVTILAVAVGLAALHGGDARAHLAGYQYVGYWVHVSSYKCGGLFTQVPNLAQHPALFECQANVKKFYVACGNPKKKNVSPGVPSGPFGPIEVIGTDLFREGDITDKTKGRAQKDVYFADEGSPLLSAGDAYCSSRNRNWSAIDELVYDVDIWVRSYSCVDSSCAPAGRDLVYEAMLSCALPPGYDISNPPPGGGVETPYDCKLMYENHVS